MKIWQLSSAIVFSLLIAAGLACLFYFPDYWAWVLLGVVLLSVGGTSLVLVRSLRLDWAWLLTAVLLAASCFAFVFFLRTGMIRWFTIGGLAFIWLIFLLNLSQKEPRRDWAQLVSLAGLFMFFYSLANLAFVFSISEWQTSLIVIAGVIMFAFPLFGLAQRRRALLYSLVVALIFAELFWVISFFPISTLATTALLILVYYVFASLILSHLAGNLDRRRSLQYIILAGILAVVVITSTNWLIPF